MSSSFIEKYCCYQCHFYVRIFLYNAKLGRKMHSFLQSLILVNPQDKQLKFLGVRQNHLSLQILEHRAWEIRLVSEC